MPYSSADLATTIKISKIQNPRMVKQTQPFKISILDSNNHLIATTKEGVTYTPTPGTFKNVSMKPTTNNDVSSQTTL
jgi:hypothetical protein